MTILDKIIQQKFEEVAAAKSKVSEGALKDSPNYSRTCYSLKDHLLGHQLSGIIAEFKRASPSKGTINDKVKVKDVVAAYTDAGASAISVLTDSNFFSGSLEDLVIARHSTNRPILRKDFVIDEYQITEAKSWGADIILLIAASLDPAQVRDLSAYAKNIGLNVLLEVHTLAEIENNCWTSIDAIGVNNRNLHTFEVDISHSIRLAAAIPSDYLKIAESGLTNPETVKELREAGFQGFLMGEHFMKSRNPGAALQEFVSQITD